MTHKTFNDEEFIIENVKLDLNSLSESDPYVDRVILETFNENVPELGYSANKKVEKSGKVKDPISGIEFEGSTDETQDQRLSEIPEKLKKLRALVSDGKRVQITTNIGRWTDDDNEENQSFYVTDDHIDGMKAQIVEEDDSEEDTEEESSEESEDDNVIL